MSRLDLSRRAFAIFAFLFTLRGYAAEGIGHVLTGSATSLQTTSEFKSYGLTLGYKELTLTNETSAESAAWNFGVNGSLAQGKVAQTDFSFQRLQVTALKKLNSFELTIAPGIANRTATAREAAQAFDGYLGLSGTFFASSIQFEVGARAVGDELQSNYSVQQNLRGEYARLQVQHTFAEKWKLGFLNKTFTLSDENVRSDSDASLLYGVSTSWPWIWLGGGAEYLTNTQANGPYWSPRQFYSYGLRSEVALPIAGQWSFAAGLNLNKFRDVDFDEGQGYYLNSKVIYGEWGKLRYELGVEAIQSEQNGNIWQSQAITAGVTCPL